MLVSARIRYHKLQPVRVFFSEQRFREGFYNVIQPDDKQKVTIDELLSKYAKVNGEVQADFRKKFDSLMKEFWKELEPSLTKDQLERIREMEKRRMEMINSRGKHPQDSIKFRNRRGMQPQSEDGRPPYGGRPSYHDSRRDSTRSK
jgi:Mg2+ and Co2+ transporter CorA